MTDIRQASQEAVEAARQGETYTAIVAALQAQQIIQAQQQPARAPAVVQQQSSAGKWIGIAVGGSVFMVAFAFAAVALAIAMLCVALVALIVYGIYKDIRKGSK
jgi:VIT1/CCC1 family predicted Fe2+/Mn2+ transporter